VSQGRHAKIDRKEHGKGRGLAKSEKNIADREKNRPISATVTLGQRGEVLVDLENLPGQERKPRRAVPNGDLKKRAIGRASVGG
jgi:hypothetical protein